VLAKDDIPLDALDRLRSVLQMAAYQVESADLPHVLKLIESVEQSRERASGVGASHGGPDPGPDPRGRWEELSKSDPGLWQDSTKIAARIRSLEDFLSTLDEQDDPPADLKAEAAAELLRWSEIAQAARQCAYIDACLSRLRKGEDLSTQRAVAIIQAAENAVPSLWGIGPSALPPALKAKIDGYPEQIESLVAKIGKARSTSILGQIRTGLKGDAERGPDQKWQEKCAAIEKQLREAQVLATRLTSPDSLLDAQKLIEQRSEDLKRCRNNQYYDYQSWVINKSDSAFRAYMLYRFGLSEADARRIFRDHTLAEVDQSLLSPEVSRIFNDVLGKLTAEMGPEALVAMEKEMGTMTKKKLEDF
jgi:hypothetical protein